MLIEMFCAARFFCSEPLAFRSILAKGNAVFGSLRFGFVALRRFACAL